MFFYLLKNGKKKFFFSVFLVEVEHSTLQDFNSVLCVDIYSIGNETIKQLNGATIHNAR